MYKIVASDNNQYGPISADAMREWFQDGRVDGQTPVQFAGGDWKHLSDYPEFADLFGGTAAAPNLTKSQNRPAHSPSFRPLHRSGAAADAEVPLPDNLLARDYHFTIGEIIGRGWTVLKGNFGTSIVVFLIPVACWIAFSVLGAVPFLGCIIAPIMLLATITVPGPLLGGQMYFFIKNARGWESAVGDTFSGFKRNFLHLALGHIVPGVFYALMSIGGALIIAFSVGSSFFASGFSSAHKKVTAAKDGVAIITAITELFKGPNTAFGALAWIGLIAGLLAIVIPLAYFFVCWIFTLPLCVDRKMNFWDAMGTSRAVVRKHWWRLFFLLVVLYLVNVVGFILCGLGLLVTVPLTFATLAVAYEEMFGVS